MLRLGRYTLSLVGGRCKPRWALAICGTAARYRALSEVGRVTLSISHSFAPVEQAFEPRFTPCILCPLSACANLDDDLPPAMSLELTPNGTYGR